MVKFLLFLSLLMTPFSGFAGGSASGGCAPLELTTHDLKGKFSGAMWRARRSPSKVTNFYVVVDVFKPVANRGNTPAAYMIDQALRKAGALFVYSLKGESLDDVPFTGLLMLKVRAPGNVLDQIAGTPGVVWMTKSSDPRIMGRIAYDRNLPYFYRNERYQLERRLVAKRHDRLEREDRENQIERLKEELEGVRDEIEEIDSEIRLAPPGAYINEFDPKGELQMLYRDREHAELRESDLEDRIGELETTLP